MNDETFEYLKIFVYFSLAVVSLLSWYRIKKRKVSIPKPNLRKHSHLYEVFLIRAPLRPGLFLFLTLITITILVILWLYVSIYFNKPKPLKEYAQYNGTIISTYYARHPNARDSLIVQGLDGSEKVFLEFFEKYKSLLKKGKNIVVWYEFNYLPIPKTSVVEIKINQNFMINYNKNYKHNLQRHYNSPKVILFWFVLLLSVLLSMYYSNYEEKPIHRLNRMKKHLKNKEEK